MNLQPGRPHAGQESCLSKLPVPKSAARPRSFTGITDAGAMQKAAGEEAILRPERLECLPPRHTHTHTESEFRLYTYSRSLLRIARYRSNTFFSLSSPS